MQWQDSSSLVPSSLGHDNNCVYSTAAAQCKAVEALVVRERRACHDVKETAGSTVEHRVPGAQSESGEHPTQIFARRLFATGDQQL